MMPAATITTEEAKRADPQELLSRLESSAVGLSADEARQRLGQYGPNEIQEKKQNPVLKFLRYFWSPIAWMIEAAVVISAIIGHWPDFWIILALLLVNAVVGFWQEYSAGNAIEQLKKKLALKARVKRDGQWAEVAARELVPGDIVRVRLGDVIPADVKLLDGDYLEADESALTGESLPVEKHVGDVGYSGAVVRKGEMDCLVVSTGLATFFGKTTQLAGKAKHRSHFQRAVVRIGNYLIALAGVMVVVIFAFALLRHQSFAHTLQFALVLTVAAIPAALPAVLSVTMAIGAIALAKKEAIVSRLAAVEEMAGVDVLCADKTGTITKNQIVVARVEPAEGVRPAELLLVGALASRQEDKDTIDLAVIKRAKDEQGVEAELGKCEVLKFTPFDPAIKRTEASVKGPDGGQLKAAKGAPQAILKLTGNEGGQQDWANRLVNEFAGRGFRALAVARTDGDGGWRLLGLLALEDPPREDSAETIRAAGEMGVGVKMVTGDHLAIARQIAGEVGLGRNIAPAEAFMDAPDEKAIDVIERADGFAQVFPEHKYRIVELLQKKGHIVGMTGDGVNDAPALKKADAGIAVSGATDAARAAADIVLTRTSLSVIVDAFRHSRQVFQRMQNYATYRITETIRVLLFITLSIIVFRAYPITALMIVLLAILNDLPIITIAYDRVRYGKRPEAWDMKTVLGAASIMGLVGVASSFLLLVIARLVLHLGPDLLQSFIYLKLAVAGHTVLFAARTRGPFWSVRPATVLLLAVLGTQAVATVITVYGILLPAMGWRNAGIVWAYALVWLIIIDFVKVQYYRFVDRRRGRIAPVAARA
jgi:H+-transporting ATPase